MTENNSEQSTRNRISEVFQKHFEHYGFKKTSVDDVAKELKISKKTIYQFFNSKEKIFYFILSKIARAIRGDMEKKLELCPSHEEKLERLIAMIFSESRKWLKKNDAFEFRFKYEIAETAFRDAYLELIRAILVNGKESGEFHFSNPDITMTFVGGIFSESMKMLSADPELDIEPEMVLSIKKLIK